MKNFTILLFFLTCQFVSSQSVANYEIIFESYWETPAQDPVNGISSLTLPGSAHWSRLAIATHKTVNSIFALGSPATAGIESIAETGATSTFVNEVTNNTDADKSVIGNDLDSAQGTISQTIEISEDYPLVSLLTMIAPSPDWFIGVNGENLRSGNSNENNGWKLTYIVDVFPYDAGTEDGNTYILNNPETNPQGVITDLTNKAPFDANNTSMNRRIGTITFKYLGSTLSFASSDNLENVKIFTKPAQDLLIINNIKNLEIHKVEVYDILGKNIKPLVINQNNSSTIELSTSGYSSGVYVILLTGTKGSIAKKVIIN